MTKQNHDAAAIVELRRYRLKPGARETLIALFDGELVDPQEEAGMTVLGQFRDIDDPDCFVWLRGFADMQKRAEALGRFYGGPIWAAHAQAANDTMVNSDNVLLLRPQTPEAEAALSSAQRPREGMGEAPAGLIVCTICHLAPGTGQACADFFENRVRPLLERASAKVLATLVSETSPNTFPRLPVREGETVFVWLSGFRDIRDYAVHAGRLAHMEEWVNGVLPDMERRVWRPNTVARLVPTGRSRLRG
ncbi:NIPSNAP family protein [Nitratireductor soli]|uniref:NIPSNAP family protein n=1 Tax=Nitratireductor soli TaxID=1670619 RepID=UPI00069DF70D|nr:NIPSNAP family protein [Nitratireductor soli]